MEEGVTHDPILSSVLAAECHSAVNGWSEHLPTCCRSTCGHFKDLGVTELLYLLLHILVYCRYLHRSYLPCMGGLCSCSSVQDGKIPVVLEGCFTSNPSCL